MNENEKHYGIPASIVDAMEKQREELATCEKNLEYYKRAYFDTREKLTNAEGKTFALRNFSSKDLAEELARREEKLKRRIADLELRVEDLQNGSNESF